MNYSSEFLFIKAFSSLPVGSWSVCDSNAPNVITNIIMLSLPTDWNPPRDKGVAASKQCCRNTCMWNHHIKICKKRMWTFELWPFTLSCTDVCERPDADRLDFLLSCQDHAWPLGLLTSSTVEPSPPSACPSFIRSNILFWGILSSDTTLFFLTSRFFFFYYYYSHLIMSFHLWKEQQQWKLSFSDKLPILMGETGVIFTPAWTGFIQGLLFYYSAKSFAGYSV